MAGLTSSVPAALLSVIAKLQAVAALPAYAAQQLQVFDGQIAKDAGFNLFVVGTVEHWRQSARTLGNLRRDEEYMIACMLQLHDGNDGVYDAPIVRALAFQLIEEVVLKITQDYSLGGAVRFCQLESGRLDQGVSNVGGWSVQLFFNIKCEVQIQQ